MAPYQISVIVPVFQVEPYLDQCIRSIREQTIQNIEIICSYTNCSDKSLEILKSHVEEDSRIKILYRDDGGLGGARNIGMQNASGEYILFVDSDDWLEKDMCETLMNLAVKNNADVAICPFVSENCITGLPEENAWGSTLPFPAEYVEKSFIYKDLPADQVVWENAPVVAWNKLYRRDFLQKNNIQFIEACRYEDNSFYYKVLVLAKSITYTNKRLYHYRINRGGSLQTSSRIDLNTFDIVPALYPVKQFLVDHHIPEEIVFHATQYILNELSWRFFSMQGIRRRFLHYVKQNIEPDDYHMLIQKIKRNSKANDKKILELSEDNLPKVSVIIPVYNGARFIEECVRSIQTQTITDLEVICVDDCSQDDTVAIIQEIAKQDPRVSVTVKKKNSGAGPSRNIGLEKARGEFVFFMDGDDLFPADNVLEKMYTAALKHKVFAVSGNLECFDVDKPGSLYEYSGHHFDSEQLVHYNEYTTHPTWGFTRFLYNYEFIIENDITFPERRYYEDPCFFVSYMAVCNTFWSLPITVYLYRVDPTHHVQLSAVKIIDMLEGMKIILPKMKDINTEMYYMEYRTLLNFFKDIECTFTDVSEKEQAEIVKLANEVLSLMDFSNAEGYLYNESFSTYQEYLDSRPKTAIPQETVNKVKAYTRKKPRLYKVLHYGRAVLKKMVKVGLRMISFVIHIIKRTIFHLFIHPYAVVMRFIFRPVINGLLYTKHGYLYGEIHQTAVQMNEVEAMVASTIEVLTSVQQQMSQLTAKTESDSSEMLQQFQQIAQKSEDQVTMLKAELDRIRSETDNIVAKLKLQQEGTAAEMANAVAGLKAQQEDTAAEMANAVAGLKAQQEDTAAEMVNAVAGLKAQQEETAAEMANAVTELKLQLEEKTAETGSTIADMAQQLKQLSKEYSDNNSALSQKVESTSVAVQNQLGELFDSVRFIKSVSVGIAPSNRKRIFLIGTPEHSNLGDAAIALGERAFIHKYFPNYETIELSGYDFNKWYKKIALLIHKDDLIFMQGGGNLGNRFLNEEIIRRKLIEDFPDNKIVILPQTIYFDDNDAGKQELEITKQIYNRHNNLTILTRGNQSLEMAVKHFTAAKCVCSLDMALMLHYDFGFDRKGILLCLRDLFDESGLTEKNYGRIERIVEAFDENYVKTNNLYHGEPHHDILRDDRWEAVLEELKKYASHQIVVTDRLHGLIFAMITHTPCVLVSAFNQKIPEFYELVKQSNAIFFVDQDIEQLGQAIVNAMKVETVRYPELTGDYFEKIFNRIGES